MTERVKISREEVIRRSQETLERCEKARLPEPEPEPEHEHRPTTGKRTITIEIACGRWNCDGCHLLDPKNSRCDAFPATPLFAFAERRGRYLRCEACLERDQPAQENPASEVCTGCDYLQEKDRCEKLNVELASIWRACEGRVSLRSKECRLYRRKMVKGQREE